MESEHISVDTEISIYRSSPVHHLDSNLLAPLSPNLDSRYVCVYSLTTATKSSPLTRADGAWWSLVQSGCEWSRNLRPPPTLISTIVTSSQSPVSVQHWVIWKLLGIFSTAERKNSFFSVQNVFTIEKTTGVHSGQWPAPWEQRRVITLLQLATATRRGEGHTSSTYLAVDSGYIPAYQDHTFKLIVINVCFWLRKQPNKS